MCDQADDSSTNGDRPPASAGGETSRRRFLRSGAGVLAAGAAALPGTALAQAAGPGAAAAELGRLHGARRTLLKGGLVLSLDRHVLDFARAQVLIGERQARAA